MTAGGSVSRWGEEQRQAARKGVWRRLLAYLGLNPAARRADARAAACDAGAEGERRTAVLLQPLETAGWWVLHDRAIPGAARANADHVLISPGGGVFLVDSKLWSGRYPVHGEGGGLWHGRVDRSRSLAAVRYEAGLIGTALGVPVQSVIAVHNADVAAGGFLVGEIAVLPACRLVEALVGNGGRGSHAAAGRLARRAALVLPPY
ncbi:nuclease-related domain-containing protein [Streptomyces eurythermus]